MNFRVTDPRVNNGACQEVSLTILYLDLGQTTLSVDYDANGTEQTKMRKTEGTTRKAGEILLGNSGEIRSQTFTLKDARFEKGVRPDKADFSLTPAKPEDFVVFGAYLRKGL